MELSIEERRVLSARRPVTRAQVAGWVCAAIGIELGDRAIIEGHACPLDYLCHAFFEDASPRDCVVWANRGGGKTFYAAVATAMDLIFKPGIEVMILGGSLDQSRRMMSHLRGVFQGEVLGPLAARVLDRAIELRNGSRVGVLAQSQTSVRGTRPQKIRCDEVDLFDRAVWEAVQMVTRGGVRGGLHVRGCVEALGTWHDPHGLLGELVEEARGRPGSDGLAVAPSPGRALFRWGVVDVLERCPPPPRGPSCDGCVLSPECAGRARRGRGHVLVADAQQQKVRADASSWASEMLCEKPSRRRAVYPEFDEAIHVRAFDASPETGTWVGGIDFGFANPTVILWAVAETSGMLRIVDERIERETTLDRHVEAIKGRGGGGGGGGEGGGGGGGGGGVGGGGAPAWPVPRWLGVDPAGNQRSEQTGVSAIAVLRSAGLRVRAKRARLEDGVRAVRARLAPATGGSRLLVHPRCEGLIGALKRYRFGARGDAPLKDGADHACDALRYLVVNLDWGGGPVEREAYW